MSKTRVQTESAIHKLKGSQNQGGRIAKLEKICTMYFWWTIEHNKHWIISWKFTIHAWELWIHDAICLHHSSIY